MAMKICEAKGKDRDEAICSFVNNVKNEKTFSEYLEYVKEKTKRMEKFIDVGKSKNSKMNQLIVLRKWNSYTPILPPDDGSNKVIKGGGYFINFQSYGIVIDPGYNFVENFLNAGCKIDDIDAIFITHAHDDHTAQLEALFSLLSKRNENTNIKKIELYLNLGAFKKFSGYFDLSNPPDNYYIDKINILNKHQLITINSNIDVFTSEVKHHEMITNKYALGLTFILKNEKTGENRVIKFTADTGWSTDIEEKNKEEAAKFGKDYDINDIDILICHIGSIKAQEMNYDTTKSLKENEKIGEVFYKNHLGIIGTVAEIIHWEPKVTLISEFGQELGAIRTKIASLISNELSGRRVFAVDLNFRIDIDRLFIGCYLSGEYFRLDEISCGINLDESIVYYCKKKFTTVEKHEDPVKNIRTFNNEIWKI